MNQSDEMYNAMKAKWPSAVVARREVRSFTGGLVSPKFLANQDSLGTGPRNRVEVCGKIAYPVDSLIEWLRTRSKTKEG